MFLLLLQCCGKVVFVVVVAVVTTFKSERCYIISGSLKLKRIISRGLRSIKSFATSAKYPKLSRKWTSKNFKNSGTFPYRISLPTGVPFWKPKNVTKISTKQVYKNVRNHCLNLTKTTKIFKIFGNGQKFWSKLNIFITYMTSVIQNNYIPKMHSKPS